MRIVDLADLDFATLIARHDLVAWGEGCAEPQSLVEKLLEQRHRTDGFQVLLGTSFSSTLRPEHADVIGFIGLGGAGSRELARSGSLDVLPLHMTALDARIRSAQLRVDVVLIQIAPGEHEGEYSLGLASDYLRGAVDNARLVIAELNDQVPTTRCVEPMHGDDIDLLVRTSRPPVEVRRPQIGPVERAIAAAATPFLPERATLGIGLGAIPEAILESLRDRRELGIHSAVIGDGVVDLVQCGAVTNEHKEVDTGVITACLLIGSTKLYRFAHREPRLLMAPVTRTHGFATVSNLRRFVAINSALEVDLTGQVNAEAIGRDYIGLVGGQLDYVRAANASPGGCAIVALPSLAEGRTRIVHRLSGPVTTPRSDVGIVVTEHGAADLRGATLRQRVERMLTIAHPAERDNLARQWQEHG